VYNTNTNQRTTTQRKFYHYTFSELKTIHFFNCKAQQAQSFYFNTINPALDTWQQASDTMRAIFMVPVDLLAPYAMVAAKNFILLVFSTLYTLWIVWRECSQFVWDCWTVDTIEAIQVAHLLAGIERTLAIVGAVLNRVANAAKTWTKASPRWADKALCFAFCLGQ
jgi:hypothetical protein